jgi:hypothetical protein
MEWSPPSTTGKAPELYTCDTALEIWSKVFSMLPGMVKTSPTSAIVTCSRRSTPSSKL